MTASPAARRADGRGARGRESAVRAPSLERVARRPSSTAAASFGKARANAAAAAPRSGSRHRDSRCRGRRCRARIRVSARRHRAGLRPSDADGSSPSEPASIDASSVRMSPNMFSVSSTSKLTRRAQQVHRRGIDQHVLERDVRKLRARSRARRPRARDGDVSSTFALSTETMRRLRAIASCARHARDALDLRGRIAADVLGLARRALLATEVDAAGQFAHDHDVDVADHLGPERRGVEHRRRACAPGAGWRTGRACGAGRADPAPGARARRGRTTAARRRRRAAPRRSSRQASIVRGGSGEPVASMAAPPISASVNSNSCSNRVATACSTRTASAVTSGPMPSPPSTAIRAFIAARLLVGRSIAIAVCASRKPSSSMPLHQAVRAKASIGNVHDCAVGQRQRRGGQVDLDLGAGIARAASDASSSSTTIGSRPFLRLLLRKMSAISVLIDGADAEVEQRPGRVLARRAAAEVAAGDQDPAALRLRLVEHEVRPRLARRRRSASRRTARRRGPRASSSSGTAPG